MAARRADRQRILANLRATVPGFENLGPRQQRHYVQARREGHATPTALRTAQGMARGLSKSQAVGHPKAEEPSVTEVGRRGEYEYSIYARTAEGGVELVVESGTLMDARRAGRYMHREGQLKRGEITPAEFRRLTRYMRPIGGRQPVSDPADVKAISARTPPKDIRFQSGRQALRLAA